MAQRKGGIPAVAAAGLPQEPAMGLGPKVRVEVVGLQDRPELNRAKGTVIGFDVGMQRWKVRLDHGGIKMFREANLMYLADSVLEGKVETEDARRDSMPPELFHEPQRSPSADQRVSPTAQEDRFPSGQDGLERRVGVMETQLSMIFSSLNEQQTLLDELVNKETFDDHLRGGPGLEEFEKRISGLEAFRVTSELALRQMQVDATESSEAQKRSIQDRHNELLRKLDEHVQRFEQSEQQWKISKDFEKKLDEQVQRLKESEEQHEELQKKIDQQLWRLEDAEQQLMTSTEQQNELQNKIDEQLRSLQESEQNWASSKEQFHELQAKLDEQLRRLQDSEQEWKMSQEQCQELQRKVDEQIHRLKEYEQQSKDSKEVAPTQASEESSIQQRKLQAVAKVLERRLDEQMQRLKDSEQQWRSSKEQHQEVERRLEDQIRRLEGSEQQWRASQEQRDDLQRRLDEPARRMEDGASAQASDEISLQQRKLAVSVKAHAAASAAKLKGIEEQLQKSDRSLGELQVVVDVLQDCLDRKNILPACSVLTGLHRRRFAAVLASSGWQPGATFSDVLEQEQASTRIVGFVHPLALPVLQTALGSSVAGLDFRAASMRGRLHSAQAAAEAEPDKRARWDQLRAAILEAEAAHVDDKQLRVARQCHVQGFARCVVERGSSRDELLAAIRAAKEAAIGDVELRKLEAKATVRIAQLDRMADAKRRLRIAISWASTNNLEKLRNAIADAEEAGVEAEEITKAEKELASIVLKEQAPEVGRPPDDLYDVLRRARPTWRQKDREIAVIKLMLSGITTVPRLAEALTAVDAEHGLNELLRRGGQKVFTEDTVKALSRVLADVVLPLR